MNILYKRYESDSDVELDTIVYKVEMPDGAVFYTGYSWYPKKALLTYMELPKVIDDNLEDWYYMLFLSDMEITCQADLAVRMGNKFPYSESSWRSFEGFLAWQNPQTTHEKLLRSFEDEEWFFKNWFMSNDFKSVIEEHLWHRNNEYVRIEGKWYEIRSNKKESWAIIYKVSDQVIEMCRAEKADKLAKKIFFKKCWRISLKYGIRRETVIYCFKGDEKAVSDFVNSLKNVIATKKEYNKSALFDEEERCAAELKRLGINFGTSSATSIAPYVYRCLKAERLV